MTIFILRDGSKVEDQRLTRLEQFDERSRKYSIQEGRTATKLRSMTWTCLPHFDQGREGACVGFGCEHELAAIPAVVETASAAHARFVYNEAKKIDPWPGENYEGTSVLAGVQILKRMGWITGYFWAFGIEDLKYGLSWRGPAVIGVRWFRGMRKPDRQGFIHATGRPLGGHCVLVKGINLKEEYFIIHNSWGTRWGVDGDCKISFMDMNKLLEAKGEAVFASGRSSKPRGMA